MPEVIEKANVSKYIKYSIKCTHPVLRFTFQLNDKNLNLCLIACIVFVILTFLIKILYYLILFVGNFKLLARWTVSYDIFKKHHTNLSS